MLGNLHCFVVVSRKNHLPHIPLKYTDVLRCSLFYAHGKWLRFVHIQNSRFSGMTYATKDFYDFFIPVSFEIFYKLWPKKFYFIFYIFDTEKVIVIHIKSESFFFKFVSYASADSYGGYIPRPSLVFAMEFLANFVANLS